MSLKKKLESQLVDLENDLYLNELEQEGRSENSGPYYTPHYWSLLDESFKRITEEKQKITALYKLKFKIDPPKLR